MLHFHECPLRFRTTIYKPEACAQISAIFSCLLIFFPQFFFFSLQVLYLDIVSSFYFVVYTFSFYSAFWGNVLFFSPNFQTFYYAMTFLNSLCCFILPKCFFKNTTKSNSSVTIQHFRSLMCWSEFERISSAPGTFCFPLIILGYISDSEILQSVSLSLHMYVRVEGEHRYTSTLSPSFQWSF